jgi:hypothetical protein
MYKPKHFGISELICPHVFEKFGDFAWGFLDPRLLMTVDVIREAINKPIIINNYLKEGEFSQRGLRCIQCELVKESIAADELYMSAHLLGHAVDFDVQDMTANQVRGWLVANQNILPFPVRIENAVRWVHLDVQNMTETKVIFFNS